MATTTRFSVAKTQKSYSLLVWMLSWVLPSRVKPNNGLAVSPILLRRTRVNLNSYDNMGKHLSPFAIMNTTIPTETELSSVNSILMALGQAQINRIFNDENGQLVYVNPEVALCHSLLMEVNTDVQNEGWVFNREGHYPLTPAADGTITVPNAILRMDVWENDIYRSSNLVQRER